MRLQKFLARAGVASRRNSEVIISEGRVSVDGITITEMGYKVSDDSATVCVDSIKVRLPDSHHYIMLNKPAGYLTTMTDPQNRKCVSSLVPIDEIPSLFPVGRLDKDTTGVLLFTTDGHMAQTLLHPSSHVKKTYSVIVDGNLLEAEAEILRNGILLDDGMTKPAYISIHSVGNASSLTITISEGRKRQIKRMFSAIRHPVLKLHRNSFAGLHLRNLKPGQWRVLSDDEIDILKKQVY